MAFGLSIVIVTVVLSSLPYAGADTRTNGVVVKLSTIPVVLGGDVNVTFHFPTNFSAGRASDATVYAFVYDGSTSKEPLHTGASQLHNDSQTATINFPCTVFDHPASYYFKYRVSSDGGQVVSINQSLTLDWGEIRLLVPTNHTALTRLEFWVEHQRRCLSKRYRDSIGLYYLSDTESGAKVTVYNKTFKRLKLSEKNPGRTRMAFRCTALDARGTYVLEYRSGFENTTLARSGTFSVHWDEGFDLTSPQQTAQPCHESLPVSFPKPSCMKMGDKVQVYEGSTGSLLQEKDVLPGTSSVFFACRHFKSSHYVGKYCFHFVTTSQKTKRTETLSKLCIPTRSKEQSMTEGWGQWTPWGMCTRSCGEGRQHRYRYCLSTSAQSDSCQGNAVETRSCSPNPCPDNPHKCACGCQLTAPEGMITSSPALFKKTGPRKCTWRISVRGNKRIKLWFDALQMDGDTILVRDGNESSASLLATVKDGFRSRPILSKGNSMYIFYNHNGKWRNGTKRGFTASYRAQEEQFVWQKKTLGTAEASFLGVFIFSILLLAIVLFAVFVKLRRQQRQNSSSGSSNTSESTSHSTLPSSPIEDEASSNEPLRADKRSAQERLERTKKRERRKRRRRSHKHNYLVDVTMQPCACAEFSGLESGSGSYSINDSYNSPRRGSVERTRAPPWPLPERGCECVQCPCRAHQCFNCERFGTPSKKYFGDWMVTEDLQGNYQHVRPGDFVTYRRDSCGDRRSSNEDFV